MNGDKLLFDSNIIIYISKGTLGLKSFTRENDLPFLSVITYMEIMSYSFQSRKEKTFIENFSADSNLIHLESNIIERGIELRKKFKIKLPDAIIAATALVNNFKLVTRNTDDFKNIPNLKLLNPFAGLDDPPNFSK